MGDAKLKTWNRNKSVRLHGFDYSSHVPYHVTIRAYSGSPFVTSALAQRCCEILVLYAEGKDAYIGCYCLMPDHLHVLLSPDRSGMVLGSPIGAYKSLTTRESWSFGHVGRLWQSRFYDHIVRKSEDIAQVAKYIYENPARKGLPFDYPHRWIAENFG